MSDLLSKLRADFELVSRHSLESGEWTEADRAEFGEAIKAAVDRKDEAILILWARDMAIRANDVLYRQMVVCSVNAGMRARIAEEKARKVGAK